MSLEKVLQIQKNSPNKYKSGAGEIKAIHFVACKIK